MNRTVVRLPVEEFTKILSHGSAMERVGYEGLDILLQATKKNSLNIDY
jgi:hypothetical protein